MLYREVKTMILQETQEIRIVIIDDHPLFREGVKRILSMEQDFNVVADGEDGSEVIDLVRNHQPDVILMDINMPKLNGLKQRSN